MYKETVRIRTTAVQYYCWTAGEGAILLDYTTHKNV